MAEVPGFFLYPSHKRARVHTHTDTAMDTQESTPTTTTPTTTMAEHDPVDWMEGGNDDTFGDRGNWGKKVAAVEAQRMGEAHMATAFRDAAAWAQEHVLQEAFASGFHTGRETGWSRGRVQGMASALEEIARARGWSEKVTEAHNILEQVKRLLEADHFDSGLWADVEKRTEALYLKM